MKMKLTGAIKPFGDVLGSIKIRRFNITFIVLIDVWSWNAVHIESIDVVFTIVQFRWNTWTFVWSTRSLMFGNILTSKASAIRNHPACFIC